MLSARLPCASARYSSTVTKPKFKETRRRMSNAKLRTFPNAVVVLRSFGISLSLQYLLLQQPRLLLQPLLLL
jgi:hypothetical protein